MIPVARDSTARGCQRRAARARGSAPARRPRGPGTPFATARSRSASSRSQLAFVKGDHELAAALERDAVRLGERLQTRLALAAQPSLERARRVVQAGVEDPAVVAGLVGRELRLLLEDGEPQVRRALGQAERRGQADDPAADDDDVVPIGHAATAPERHAQGAPRACEVLGVDRIDDDPALVGPALGLCLGLAGDQHAARGSGTVGAATSWSR